MPTFPSDAQRGVPAYFTKLGPLLLRSRYRTNVGDSNAANKVPLIIQAATSQTADLVELYDASKNFLWGLDSAGVVTLNSGNTKEYMTTVAIASADITGTGAGQLGHANGYPLVADPGAGKAVEFAGALLSYTFGTAAYTGGGNITINIGGGGAALTGLISFANSLGAAVDKLVQFVPLAAAAQNMTVNKGINLVAASAPTQPGTAAGTVKVFLRYRIHTL
jgi:hypothetical protein